MRGVSREDAGVFVAALVLVREPRTVEFQQRAFLPLVTIFTRLQYARPSNGRLEIGVCAFSKDMWGEVGLIKLEMNCQSPVWAQRCFLTPLRACPAREEGPGISAQFVAWAEGSILLLELDGHCILQQGG